MFSTANTYNAVNNIGGWFYPEDAIILQALNMIQDDLHIVGDMLEVGVYHGKSAAFLGFLIRSQERFFVCDTFQIAAVDAENKSENSTWYPDTNRDIFEKNYFEIHKTLPQIVTCNSRRLKAVANLSRTFRLIHIDGSHLYSIVREDLSLAADLLKPGGIVAIDDYRSAHTPGVAAATWEAIFRRKFVPICLTPQKLYVSLDRRARGLSQKLYEWARDQTQLQFSTETIHRSRIIKFCAMQ